MENEELEKDVQLEEKVEEVKDDKSAYDTSDVVDKPVEKKTASKSKKSNKTTKKKTKKTSKPKARVKKAELKESVEEEKKEESSLIDEVVELEERDAADMLIVESSNKKSSKENKNAIAVKLNFLKNTCQKS